LNLAELFHDIAKLAALAVKYAISKRRLSQKAIAELYRSYSGLFASVAKHHSLQVLNNVVAISLKGMNNQYVAYHSNPIILVRALKKKYSQHLA
jgi:hypothetical protein